MWSTAAERRIPQIEGDEATPTWPPEGVEAAKHQGLVTVAGVLVDMAERSNSGSAAPTRTSTGLAQQAFLWAAPAGSSERVLHWPYHRGVPRGRSRGHAQWSVWWVPGITALVGHVLLVPLYFAARSWDLYTHPLGSNHWPGEPGWPAGSGSSEWRPGEVLVIVSWVLLWVVVLCACLVAGLIASARRHTS